MAARGSVRVLIVDDSSVLRNTLRSELSKYPQIEVVGVAPDPFIARDLIVKLRPDVLSLDVEMPRMDGITFLQKLMQHFPMPVVILSSLTAKGGALAMEALDAGAVAVLCKPRAAFSASGVMKDLAKTLVEAGHTDVKQLQRNRHLSAPRHKALAKTTNLVLAIGSSTGGTTALESVLKALPPNLPGTVISQHLPELFTKSFAERLANETGLDVREAEGGESIIPGRVLLAPGNRHLVVERSGARYVTSVENGPRVNNHRPSVDVMFESVARSAGSNAIGVILTGMGRDGAKGMLRMKEAGALNFAQDERSCVVYGMPKAAVELDATHKVLSLQDIPGGLVKAFQDSA